MPTMRARRACSQFWKWTLTRASMTQAAQPTNQIHAVFLVIRVIGMIMLRREGYDRGTGAVLRACSTLIVRLTQEKYVVTTHIQHY